MSTINYAVEITTDSTTITDVTYGLALGVFRWITGRPGYTGVAPFPTNEDTSNNTYRWFEDFLLIDGMGNPNRRVDLTRTGDYGTLSGFDFKIRNDQKFWQFIEDSEIWLCNRSIKLYVVIDNVFYQIWDGVISNEPYNETDYTFTCVDKFKVIHKEMPPGTVNETQYPNADSSSLGTTIPVTFGDVQYAALVKLSNKKTVEKLVKGRVSGGPTYEFESSTAMFYSITDSADPVYDKSLFLVTKGVDYAKDALKGKYLIAIAGEEAEKSRLIRITGNEPTTKNNKVIDYSTNPPQDKGVYDYTWIGLEEPLAYVTPLRFDTEAYNLKYRHGLGPGHTDTTWWFQVVTFSCSVTPSQGGVLQFVRDPKTNLIKLYTYDSKTAEFIPVQDQLYATVLNGGKITEITLNATSVNEDGQIEVISPIPFTTYKDSMYDFDQSTFSQSVRDATPDWNYGQTPIPIWPVNGYDYTNVSAVYLGVDFSTQKVGMSGSTAIQFRLRFECYDVYGFKLQELSEVSDTIWGGANPQCSVSATEQKWFILPKEYYSSKTQTLVDSHWGDIGYNDLGEGARLGDLLKMPVKIIDALKTNQISRIDLYLGFHNGVGGGGENSITVKNYEVGLFSLKFMDTLQGQLYGQVSGETLPDGQTTNTVYGAFRLMMETYDGILPANIDYGNIPSVRGDWIVSRQMTEKKNSFEYLKELAEQSFVAIAPTRTGKRLLSAWRKDTTLVATHTETSIVRDSIKKFKKTEVMDLFNDFTLEYHYNQGTKKYERTLKIKNVDQAAFPADTTETWKSYVCGMNPDGGWPDANLLWSMCRKSYLRSKAILTAPESITQLNWYADSAPVKAGEQSPGASIDDSSYKFLKELCQWCTLQKETVTYRLPISAANIALELLDYVNFSDAIYTASTLRPGWITYVEVDTKNDQVLLETTLNPLGLARDNSIVERGIYMNEDTITEDFNQDNSLSEPQVISTEP